MTPGRIDWLIVPLALVWVTGSRGISLERWAVVVTVFGVAALAFTRLVAGVRAEPVALWFVAFASWVTVDAALRPVDASPAAWSAAAAVTAAAIFFGLRSPRRAWWAAVATGCSGTLLAALVLVERMFSGLRPAGPFLNPNLAATPAVLALAVLPALRLPSAATASLAVLLGGGLVASGSRGGMLAALAVALTAGFVQRSRRARVAVLLPVVLIVAGLVWKVASDADVYRFERIRIWSVAVNTAMSEMPLGSGPGGFVDAALPYNFARDGEFARYHRVPGVAESDLLQAAAVLGLPGLALLAGLGVVIVRRADARAAPVLVAITVTSLVNTQLCFPAVGWTAVVALAAVLPFSPRPVRWRASVVQATLWVVPVALVAGAALSWPRPGLSVDAEALLGRALAVTGRSDGDLARAEALFEAATTRRPRWAAAWRGLGAVRSERGRRRAERPLLEAALGAFERARVENPNDPFAALGEAETRRLLGDDSGARTAIRDALRLEPNFVTARVTAAVIDYEAGRVVSACASVERVESSLGEARRILFVSDYERALFHHDPGIVDRLRRNCSAQ